MSYSNATLALSTARRWRTVWAAALALMSLLPAPAIEAAESTETPRLSVILLPTQAVVYRVGFTGVVSDEWTVTARANLDAALRAALEKSTKFELEPLPEVSAEEREVISEFLKVALLVGVQMKGGLFPAEVPRSAIDRNLGPGLSFLRDRTGAEYALGVVASQAEQSKTVAAANFVDAALMFAVPGYIPAISPTVTGSATVLCLVNLVSGELRWLNTEAGYEVAGYNFTDLRDPKSVTRDMDKLLSPYPTMPLLDKNDGVGKKIEHGKKAVALAPFDGGFSVRIPEGWHTRENSNSVAATRNGRLIDNMSFEFREHNRSFLEIGRRTRPGSTPKQLLDAYIALLEKSGVHEFAIVEQSTDARLAGLPAFRVRFSHRPPPPQQGPRSETLALGAVDEDGFVVAEYTAIQLNYFEESASAFEQSLQTLKTAQRRRSH